MPTKTYKPSDRSLLFSIALVLAYIALVLTIALVATALQRGGPF